MESALPLVSEYLTMLFLTRLFRLSRREYRRRRSSLQTCLSEIQQFEARQMPAAAAAVAHEWNTILLDCIRDQKSAPPIASRAMAITSAAIFEAVNAIDGSYASNIRFPRAGKRVARVLKAAAAAAAGMEALPLASGKRMFEA